jgi:glycosyltransferase involved in cell wall biosynthesis
MSSHCLSHMQSLAPTVSVVIISTRQNSLRINLPRVIASASSVVAEVILVCQGYKPDVNLVESKVYMKVFYSPGLLGSSSARNFGADNATGDFICFFDDDIYPQLDFFQLSLNYFDTNPSVAGVLGAIHVKNDIPSSLFRKFNRPAAKNLSEYLLWRLSNGNSGVFRRTGLRFDTRLGIGSYFGSCEDGDYILSISRFGSIDFLPGAIVYHPNMDEKEINEEARMISYARGLGGCFAKNPSIGTGIFLVASLLKNILSFVTLCCLLNFGVSMSHIKAALAKIYAIFEWRRLPKQNIINSDMPVRVIPISVRRRTEESK